MSRPGIATTEFWVSLTSQGLAYAAVLHPGFKAPPGTAQALAAVLAGIASAGYATSRAIVKHAEVKAAAPQTVINNITPVPKAEDIAVEMVKLWGPTRA